VNIPDEAVEAAAKALYFYLDEDHRGQPASWESLGEDDEAKIDAKEAARIALAAAAPYMIPDFRESNLKAIAEELANPLNPYRSQA